MAGMWERPLHALRAELGIPSAQLALFEGQSLTQYADQSGLAIGTVRQQVKSVFRKTGTGRQAELVTWMRRLQSYDGA